MERAFIKWFGDSKVLDEKGEPLIVYRGSAHSATKRYSVTYFTADRRLADIYAADRAAGSTDARRVVGVHLSLQNPASDRDILRISKQLGIRIGDERFPAGGLETNEPLIAALKAAGFDGVIGTDGDMEGPPQATTVYVTFDHAQIHEVEERVYDRPRI